MTPDPPTLHALELLTRGHRLYAGERVDARMPSTPAELLTRVRPTDGTEFAAPLVQQADAYRPPKGY